MCEVAKEEQLNHGKTRVEAITEAAKVRLRPILMTTAAMIAGLVPLLYATGARLRYLVSVLVSLSWQVWQSVHCLPCSCCQ